MWEGIIVMPGGTVDIKEGSIIADAVTAIKADNSNALTPPKITIDRFTTLENNWRTIQLTNGKYVNSTVRGSTFRCTSGLISKNPYYGLQPPDLIYLENVVNGSGIGLTIGNANSGNENHFADAMHGIVATNSSFHVINDIFTNIGYLEIEGEVPPVLIQQGGAIKAISDDAAINTVVIDDNSTGFPNKFIRCNTGIIASGIANLTIQNNNKAINDGGFENCTKAITIYNAPENSVTTVTANDATDYNYGLQMFDLGQNSQFYINGNWFNCDDTHNPLSFNASTASYKAISIQNILTVDVVGTVLGNIISNTQKGIHLRNIANRHPGQLQIGIAIPNLYSNQVHYLNTPAPSGNDHYFGFWFENCDNLTVDNNLAFSNTTPLGAGIDKRFRGFSVDNTTNSNFCSNKAEQMGSGVWVYNKCAGTMFHGTTVTNNYDQFHLVNADIPPQGDNTLAWGNYWEPASGRDIVGWTNGNQITWYHETGALANYTPNLFYANNINPGLSTATDANCIAPPPQPLDERRREMFGDAVTDSADYGEEFPIENKYQDKEAFYKAAKEDSTILVLGLPDDSVFVNTFDSLANTNVGTLAEVEEEFRQDELASAVALNQGISPLTTSETNSKQANEIYFFYNTDSLHHLNSARTQEANMIADQNSIEGGLAVYIMRALLNKDVVDDPVSSFRKAGQPKAEAKKEFSGKMYPNPAGNYITYQFDSESCGTFEISDVLGRKLIYFDLLPDQKTIQINTSALPPAVYLYKVLCASEIKQQGKFTIIK